MRRAETLSFLSLSRAPRKRNSHSSYDVSSKTAISAHRFANSTQMPLRDGRLLLTPVPIFRCAAKSRELFLPVCSPANFFGKAQTRGHSSSLFPLKGKGAELDTAASPRVRPMAVNKAVVRIADDGGGMIASNRAPEDVPTLGISL
jgi:hypothetical protein